MGLSTVECSVRPGVTLTHTLPLSTVGVLQETLNQCGGRVLVLSFGVLEGARRWLADTQCHFDMAIDTDRQVTAHSHNALVSCLLSLTTIVDGMFV